MRINGKRVLLCSCEGSMTLDAARIAAPFGTEPSFVNSHLCRTQIDNFKAALEGGEPVLVCCSQEAPLFAELAEDADFADIGFVNIRERAGWSDEGAKAAPKIAALLAEAMLPVRPTPALTLTSDGALLIYGHGQAALDAARRLSGRFGVTLLLTGAEDGLLPPAAAAFPIYQGHVERSGGHLGDFAVKVPDLTPAEPAGRGALRFAGRGQAATLSCDLILDLSGATPMFPAPDMRDGYLRVDPRNPAAVEKALFELTDLIGEFEKPRYVKVDTDICAHSRNSKTGCTRCLDACPTGSILSMGDHIAVDAQACAGHGACAAVCPTGAISYDLPAGNALFERVRVLLSTFRKAGGKQPQLLIHDGRHGEEMISVMARLGPGLPAAMLPVAVNEVTAIGIDLLLMALAHGAARIVLLTGPAQRDHLPPLEEARDLVEAIMTGLGYEGGRVVIADQPDPMALAEELRRPAPPAAEPAASFMVLGGKRNTLGLALGHLHQAAPAPVDILPLAAGAPFGVIEVDRDKCTLCLSCVGACPAHALSDNPDKPQLSFLENACVQCGLCRVTCPEGAIGLTPRLNFTGTAASRRVMKEEEPFHCIRCAKPFGTRSSIEKIVGKLANHPMFQGSGRLDLIRMCDDCRVVVQFEQETRPLAGNARPAPRTTDDYLRDRAARQEKDEV